MGNQDYLYDETVTLTPLGPDHVPVMTRWVNDQAVLYNLAMLGGMAEDEEHDWLNRTRSSQRDLVLGIVRRSDSRYIGNVGLHGISPENQTAEYGIMIGERDCWGQGLGTAAGRLMLDHGFNRLNLRRIFLRVLDFNQRGTKSYEKLGFQFEGRQRQQVFREGRYFDMLYMGLMREEFNVRWADWRQAQTARYGIGE
ncbi:GNAT family N-acetyltransferase [bacterium]|nr:GNAT family N-acetyltransferase [bacterium]